MSTEFISLPGIHNVAGQLLKASLIKRQGQDEFSVLIQSAAGEWEFDVASLVVTLLTGTDFELGVEGDETRSMTIATAEVVELTRFIFSGWRHHGMLFTVRVESDYVFPRAPLDAVEAH